MTLEDEFGRIDIYVFDQLLRGNIAPGMRVVDAGCGHGRNLVYLLRQGYEVFGVDADAGAVESVRRLARAAGQPVTNFQVAAIEAMPFADSFADVVVCNSVLHFSRDDAHFDAMVGELWRVLRPGGMLFCRLGSTIGMEGVRGQGSGPRVQPTQIEGRLFRMGDGAEWYLVDEAMLMEWTGRLGGALIDPLKTTVVQAQRCMTTWVVRKRQGFGPR